MNELSKASKRAKASERAPGRKEPSGRGMTRRKLVVQTIGFVIGMLLLAWTLRLAFAEENRDAFEELGRASWHQVGAMVMLGVLTLGFNGMIFWAAIRPVKRLPLIDVQAVNAIASLLSYLPFKLSLLFRTAVHNRRDGVPIFTIGSWFGAVGVMMLAVLLPLLGASVWRRGIDLWWMLTAVVGIGLSTLVIWKLAGLFSFGEGLDRFRRLIDLFRIKPLSKAVRTDTYAKMHTGIVMLADPRALLTNIALRLCDVSVHTARFKLAAAMLGVPLTWEQATLSGVAYFLLGAGSPAGALGVREAGTIGTVALLGIADPERFAAVAVVVTASETVAWIIGTVAGVARLNPAKLARLEQERKGGLDVDPESGERIRVDETPAPQTDKQPDRQPDQTTRGSEPRA